MSPLAKESPYIYPEHPKLKSKAPQVVGRPNYLVLNRPKWVENNQDFEYRKGQSLFHFC